MRLNRIKFFITFCVSRPFLSKPKFRTKFTLGIIPTIFLLIVEKKPPIIPCRIDLIFFYLRMIYLLKFEKNWIVF